MIVADVGAGTGYMTLRMAKLVGASGKVYAEDLIENLLDRDGDPIIDEFFFGEG